VTEERKRLEVAAWTELVSYWECPICNEVVEMGANMVFDDGAEEWQCPNPNCEAKVLVKGPPVQ
jgi:rubredoxin